MSLAKGGARIDHYVVGWIEWIGMNEQRQVVISGKTPFSCRDGITFPGDRQLAGDLGQLAGDPRQLAGAPRQPALTELPRLASCRGGLTPP